MQRLGQLYKNNMTVNTAGENKQTDGNRSAVGCSASDSDVKPEQSVQQIVEGAIK